MQLRGIIKKDLFHPDCNPSFQTYNCIAYLDGDIGDAVPYLNTELGGTVVVREPPSVTFKAHGRLITVHGDRIAVNALKSGEEADIILAWLIGEIRNIWERRESIAPSWESPTPAQPLDILRRLPKTNCRQCGQPTCLVFATLAVRGVVGGGDCPELDPGQQRELDAFLDPFPPAKA